MFFARLEAPSTFFNRLVSGGGVILKCSNEELVRIAALGDKSALEELYKNNSGLIYKICKPLADDVVLIEDLIQESYFALIKAVEGYKTEFGVRFSTYFTTTLQRYMWRYKKQFKDRFKSLNAPIIEGEDISLQDMIVDLNVNIEADVTDSGLIKAINGELMDLLNTLPENERVSVIFKYFKGLSRAYIAKALHVKPQDVQNILDKAMRKLRAHSTIGIVKSLREHALDIESAGFRGTGLSMWKYTNTSSTERTALKLYEGKLFNDYESMRD